MTDTDAGHGGQREPSGAEKLFGDFAPQAMAAMAVAKKVFQD